VTSKVHIGTSGWHYKHWRGKFYPEDLPTQEWLKFYSKRFGTVELNNSFYRLPERSSFDNWRETTPAKFLFAVKASRFITHMKKLKDAESSSEKFFANADHLEKKLGPILFQLPPRWHLNLDRLDEFLNSIPKQHRYVFEFREESWLTDEVFDLLKRYNVALCIHDLGGQQSPLEITANFTYLRFHGPGKARYAGSYSTDSLESWAAKLTDWRNDLREVYVYFNNDIGGCAVKNALELKSFLA